MSTGMMRVLLMVWISFCGALSDWSAFHLCEIGGVSIPDFNFAICWIIRTILIFSCVGYFAWWTACSGKRTFQQRIMFWVAMIVCFVAVDVPVLMKSIQSDTAAILSVGWVIFPVSILGYAVTIMVAQTRVWTELDSGAN